jgi:hypothetical protein
MLATCFHAGFFLGLFFDPEDGGDMFLRNVGLLSTDYTALYPRGQKSSECQLLHIFQLFSFQFSWYSRISSTILVTFNLILSDFWGVIHLAKPCSGLERTHLW